VPTIDFRDVPLERLIDARLHAIAAGGLLEREEDDTKVLLLAPDPKSSRPTHDWC
jgi:hypothetical protein